MIARTAAPPAARPQGKPCSCRCLRPPAPYPACSRGGSAAPARRKAPPPRRPPRWQVLRSGRERRHPRECACTCVYMVRGQLHSLAWGAAAGHRTSLPAAAEGRRSTRPGASPPPPAPIAAWTHPLPPCPRLSPPPAVAVVPLPSPLPRRLPGAAACGGSSEAAAPTEGYHHLFFSKLTAPPSSVRPPPHLLYVFERAKG